MRKLLFSSVFALCAARAIAADTARCDATAFALRNPAPAPKEVAKPKPAAKPATAHAAPTPAKPKTTTRLLSKCKDGKAKKRG